MSKYSLHQGDAVSWLASLEPESVDCVITDPAYESLEKYRSVGTTTRLKKSKGSSNEWFDIFPNSRYPVLFQNLYRVLKPNSHLYMFCDQETGFITKPMGEAVGFKFWKAITWDKCSPGMGYHYRNQTEWVLFFEKGKRRLNDLGMSDVRSYPRIRGGYPTEKPVGLLTDFIKQSTQPKDLVVDPFMGSGSTGAASLSLDRRFLGNDLSVKSLEFVQNRLTSCID